MIMCVLLCYPVSIHMSQLLSTGRPISSLSSVDYSVTHLNLSNGVLNFVTYTSIQPLKLD